MSQAVADVGSLSCAFIYISTQVFRQTLHWRYLQYCYFIIYGLPL